MTETYPDTWAIDWVSDKTERKEKAASWGVADSDVPRLVAWVTSAFGSDFGWPNVFLTFDAAKRFVSELPPGGVEWNLLGLGLHPSDLETFLADTRAPEAPPGYAPMGEAGVHEAAMKRDVLQAGGEPLGFDVLGLEPGYTFHSWFCNYLEKDMAERYGIRPGENGLLPTYDSAKRAADHARVSGAEPVPWFPYLVVSYSE